MRHRWLVLTHIVSLIVLLAACGAPIATPAGARLPTTAPRSPAYVTPRPSDSQLAQGIFTALHLTGILDVRIAVHPTQGWPAIGATHRIFDVPIQAYYRAFDPAGNGWNALVGLDTGDTTNGDDANASSLVAITQDQTVHAVWGPADATDALYHARSTDHGRTWDTPQQITTACLPHDMVGHQRGLVVLVAACLQPRTTRLLVYDTATRHWTPLPLPVTGVAIDLELIEVAGEVRAVVWQATDAQLSLSTLRLSDGALLSQSTPAYPMDAIPLWGWKASSVAYQRQTANEHGTLVQQQPAVTFAWGGFARAAIYVTSSFDGGLTWEPVEVAAGGDTAREDPLRWPVPFYDPISDSLLVIYTCCTGGVYGAPETTSADRTHRLVWRQLPGPRSWPTASHTWSSPRELATGALQLRVGRGAQAPGSRTVWLAWTEHDGRVRTRTLALGDLLPPQAYPPDPTLPTPGAESTPLPFRAIQPSGGA